MNVPLAALRGRFSYTYGKDIERARPCIKLVTLVLRVTRQVSIISRLTMHVVTPYASGSRGALKKWAFYHFNPSLKMETKSNGTEPFLAVSRLKLYSATRL